jgi:hypothetical protein
MNRFRRKNTYDPQTGNIQDDKRYMTMNEDYWFARRDGKGTQVDVLSGGANLNELQDVVQMYKDELFESLYIPQSRYKDGANFSLGRASEISRDDLKFQKYITRLRKRFSHLFDDLLSTQLILKGIISIEDWENIRDYISYDYLADNHFTELKNSEIWSNRMSNFRDAQDSIGVYFSKKFAVKTFLQMSEDEWENMKKEIEEEHKEDPPVEDPNDSAPDGADGEQDPQPATEDNDNLYAARKEDFDDIFNELNLLRESLKDKKEVPYDEILSRLEKIEKEIRKEKLIEKVIITENKKDNIAVDDIIDELKDIK